MQPKIGFHLLLVALAFAAPLPLDGDEPPDRRDGNPACVQTTTAAAVSRELAILKKTLSRLEEKVDRLLEQPSEFSPVKVRIVDEQGEPMSGFEVELTSAYSVSQRFRLPFDVPIKDRLR